ncbi:ABC transporter ATP-binding protein [Clostridium butyricum]|uniref:ABC transporter ATP-binding protein n=1 Tax=Clostridium butyricum TaxID=1492 RepID=UPI00137160CE|nr:ABC transporter ATP-binding protein [Clostridium butyricum]MZI81193.1 ATP-binding cassette domain-containing protein [Clostridium butyricum]
MIKKLIPYARNYKKAFILSSIFASFEAVFELLIPLVMSEIVDTGISTKNIVYTIQLGLVMVSMVSISLCFGFALSKYAAIAGQGFGAEIRETEYKKIQYYSIKKLEKYSSASLITRLTTDVTAVQNCVTMGIKLLVRAPIMFICALCLSAIINKKLALIFLVAMPILILAISIIVINARPKFQRMQKKIDNLNRIVQENLIGIRVVKSFVSGVTEKKKFREENNDLLIASEGAFSIVILNMPVIQIVLFGTIICILWFGGNMVNQGILTVGKLSSFIAYSVQMLTSLMMISMVLMMIARSFASVQRIIEVLEEEKEIEDSSNPITVINNGEVEFKNVYFKYEEDSKEYNLENINLKIKSGDTIGIIGSTGSAKTSLVQLIPRLYDATGGEIYVGGNNVKSYSLETLRNNVVIVMQNNTLFSGSIKENLKWANEDALEDEFDAACEVACAKEFINKLPDGYDTELGQGGVNISGGQKQRLYIARAILKKPKILILDDSTSSIDSITNAKIRKTFTKTLKGITKIIISQRIISVCNADRIIVIDDGKISAIGTHEELIKTNNIYQDMYNCQQEGVGFSE